MIVTLTANPSLDHTVTLAGLLERGAVQRTAGVLAQPGGKGINISRACRAAGVPTTAVFPAPATDPVVRGLQEAGVPVRLAVTDTPVRTNLTITEPDGTTTKLNSPGAALGPATLADLARGLHESLDPLGWAVLAGSLPPGAPADLYADLTADLRRAGRRVAVDTSDAPLAALLGRMRADADCAPTLLKPNAEELASVAGGSAEQLEADPAAAARAARTLLDLGVTEVLATLGGRGAVYVSAEAPDTAWHALPGPTTVISTVGAGDASLFGHLLGHLRGLAPAPRLALAVAYGSAAAGLPGTTTPQPDDVRPDRVVVTEFALTGKTGA